MTMKKFNTIEEAMEDTWNYLAHVYAVDVDDEADVERFKNEFPDEFNSSSFQMEYADYQQMKLSSSLEDWEQKRDKLVRKETVEVGESLADADVDDELGEDEWFDDEEFCEEDYTPSATRGDYSPSNPWDAPGMSIRDFI